MEQGIEGMIGVSVKPNFDRIFSNMSSPFKTIKIVFFSFQNLDQRPTGEEKKTSDSTALDQASVSWTALQGS